jgi:dTDP-glucose 4,6-dehydratase
MEHLLINHQPPDARTCCSRSGLANDELRELVLMSAACLRELADASVLITGGTGWFGTWFLDFLCAADDLLDLGIRITAVSREPDAFLDRFPGFRNDERISWIKCDVRQLTPDSRSFSHVIHAATDSSAKGGSMTPQMQFDTIIEGTRRTLACAGPNCKSFLFLSSGAVYGPPIPGRSRFMDGQSGGPDPALPKNAYAEGKRAAEQLCAIAADMGTPVRIARCFAFVGPHMPFDKHFAIGNFIADAVGGRPIHIKSDGTPQRSYLYMSDLMRALVSILIDGVTGRTYNVGSDSALTIKELADRVNLVVGGQGVTLANGASDPADRYVPDTTRLSAELKFVPAVPLDTAIARTAAWYRDMIRHPIPLV